VKLHLCASKVIRHLPENIVKADEYLFENELSKEIEPLFVYTKTNLFIIKGHAVFDMVLKPALQYSHTSCLFAPFKERLKISFDLIKSPLLLFKGHYYWATDDWSTNYFHWMIDSFQKIYLLEKINGPNELLFPDSLYSIPFIKSSLKYIRSKVHVFESKINLKVTSLTSISYPAPIGNFNPLTILEYRQWLLDNIPVDNNLGQRNIYISRSKATIRKVLNENDVVLLLEKYNFKTICLEDYTWEEQASIFKKAKNIIGIHGAGLTNCIFSTNAKVLEFRKTNDDKNNCYFSLCNVLNHKYYYQLDNYELHSREKYNDLLIDLEQLEKIIRKNKLY
jgi:capsular polysaccharide biosynthesis protein